MSYQVFKKIRIQMTEWDQKFDLPVTYQNVRAVKIRWLSYQTAAPNNKELIIVCDELGDGGIFVKPNRSNVKYLLSVPLDQALATTCLYANYTTEMDMVYDAPRSLNLLSFSAFINGVPATALVTNDSPIDFEIVLYN
jgi:hypothetical protein